MNAGDSSVAAEVPFWYWSNWLHIGTRKEDIRTVVDLVREHYAILDRLNFGCGKVDPEDVPLFEAETSHRHRGMTVRGQ